MLVALRSRAGTLGAHIEVFVEPDNALGGPRDQPYSEHLTWLRQQYRTEAHVRQELQFLASIVRRGQLVISEYSRTPQLAATLSPKKHTL